MLKTSAKLALLFSAAAMAATAPAAAAAAHRARGGAQPVRGPRPSDQRQSHRPAGVRAAGEAGHSAGQPVLRRGVPPPGAPGRDRHAADGAGGGDFLADKSPDKRTALIDRLLKRDEFADYWAMKWCDLLRVKAEFPINLWPNAAQAYHRWIRTSIKENKPYDRFVREMLTASGSNFRTPAVNFYRAMQSRQPEAIARTVALTFMGVRAENWPKDRLEVETSITVSMRVSTELNTIICSVNP